MTVTDHDNLPWHSVTNSRNRLSAIWMLFCKSAEESKMQAWGQEIGNTLIYLYLLDVASLSSTLVTLVPFEEQCYSDHEITRGFMSCRTSFRYLAKSTKGLVNITSSLVLNTNHLALAGRIHAYPITSFSWCIKPGTDNSVI